MWTGSEPHPPIGLSHLRRRFSLSACKRFLARAGVASRCHAEALTLDGRGRVNGRVVTELGTKVQPGTDEVIVDGQLVQLQAARVDLLLHQPAEVVTTASDLQGRWAVLDLLPVEATFPNPVVKEWMCQGNGGKAVPHCRVHTTQRVLSLQVIV